MRRSHLALAALLSLACTKKRPAPRVSAACATLEVLHDDVTVDGAPARTDARVGCDGTVRTGAHGRVVLRTDRGLELRVAGNAEVSLREGRPRVVRGRTFASAWGDQEHVLSQGDALTLRLTDAALAVEREVGGGRVVVVRGEVSFRSADRQGQLAQGEALLGDGAPTPQPAPVWDDWTGGAAAPRAAPMEPPRALGVANAWTAAGEAPTPLATNLWRADVSLRGDLAVTTLEQRFFNGAERAATVEFSVRLPEGALVAGFALARGARWLPAVPGVVSNSSSGGTSALYAASDGSLRATLGVLAPGDSLGTRITFAQWLPRVGPTRRYALPLGAPQEPGMIGEFSFDMDVTGEPLTAVRLPQGARLQNGHVRLQHGDWRPRGTLAVDLIDDAAPAAARAWIPSYTPRGDRRVMRVEVALPATPSSGTDFAVVLDDSAATGAGSLDIARAAIDALLRQLGAQDRVALLFGDLGARPAEGDLGRLGAVTAARRERVLDAVARVRPGGASDLGRMLSDAHAALDPRRNGVVIYLGDGSPTVGLIDPTRLAESLRRACPDLRLLGLAIGQGAHDDVLRALAGAGGEVQRVEDPPEAVARMSAMAARATRPLLRDVRLNLGTRAQQVVPEVLDALPAGEILQVYTLLDEGETPPKRVRVDAREAGAARTWTFPLGVSALRDDGDVMRRMATARISALESAGAARAAVADIGARYGLITPASALLVGVDPISPAVGWTVSASPWILDDGARALPSLGVGSLGPRGVTTLVARRELAVAVDDGDGWHPHRADEGSGADPSGPLAAALAGAEPVARACVARKRALRPNLAGAVTIGATVDATGRITAADIADSTLRDVETESCIRRAVQGLTLPPPALLGASPTRVSRRFEFPGGGEGTGLGATECPSSARLSRAMRRVLWRERLNLRGATPEGALGVWSDAARRCELRWWEDRVALLDLFLDTLADPTALARVRDGLDDASAADWLDAAIARQFGSSRAWRALHRAVFVDWGALLNQLSSPTLTPEARVTLLRAWLAVAPRDLDLRLRLLDALEAAGREREARSVADGLRRDPIADARVRGRVGEFLLRLGDRAEALRALSEIVEFAPYDPWARARLGDLLLAAAEPALAHRQFQTLTLLDNADPMADARLGLAALGAGREDEGLRALRRAVEAAGEGDAGRDLLALFAVEVARVSAARRDDPGARAWSRVGRQLGPRHRPQVMLRWTHPDVGLELLVQRAGEPAPTTVGTAATTLGLRTAVLEESDGELRVVLRAVTRLRAAREVRCSLAVLLDGRLTERTVILRPNASAVAFTLRAGELSPAATLPTDGASTPVDD